jgi:chloramphenicol 3-O phosphotransferase
MQELASNYGLSRKVQFEMPAHIVLLNGVGSVGKSSIAKALQNITTEPFLHVEMDAFLAMMPSSYLNHSDGLSFDTTLVDGKPSVLAKTGPVAKRVLSGMRQAVASMAAAGNNLIVDEVLFGNTALGSGSVVSEYQTLLAPFQLHFVGVFAPLDVLERRERQRGDRLIGLARWQYNIVHEAMDYDFEIETASATADECAHLIKERLGL